MVGACGAWRGGGLKLDRPLHSAILPHAATWYAKRAATFSDALAAVRRAIWAHEALRASASDGEAEKVPRAVLDRLRDLACYAA